MFELLKQPKRLYNAARYIMKWAALLVILIFSCSSRDNFKYYSSPDSKRTITLMTSSGRTFFIAGNYKNDKRPTAYISPTSGIDNGYYCYIHWNGNFTEILSAYGDWEEIGNDYRIKFRKISDKEQDLVMKNKTGKYTYCSGDVFPN